MTIRLIISWALYIIVALILQKSIPGIDALAPGFLLALQFSKKKLTVCLFILFCLIQEGSGSLNFGSGVLWYGGQILLFCIGARFFSATSFPSVLLFSCLFTAWHGVLFFAMTTLQGSYIDLSNLMVDSVLQIVFFPLIWLVAFTLRNHLVPHVTR